MRGGAGAVPDEAAPEEAVPEELGAFGGSAAAGRLSAAGAGRPACWAPASFSRSSRWRARAPARSEGATGGPRRRQRREAPDSECAFLFTVETLPRRTGAGQ
mgnify:CR=1 FL=1